MSETKYKIRPKRCDSDCFALSKMGRCALLTEVKDYGKDCPFYKPAFEDDFKYIADIETIDYAEKRMRELHVEIKATVKKLAELRETLRDTRVTREKIKRRLEEEEENG